MNTVQAHSCATLHQRLSQETNFVQRGQMDPIADQVAQRMDNLDDKESASVNALRDLFFEPGTNRVHRKVYDFFYSLIFRLGQKLERV